VSLDRSSAAQALVERQERQRPSVSFRRDRSCRELEYIGSAERMHPQQPSGHPPDLASRLHFEPSLRDRIEPVEGVGYVNARSFDSRDSRYTFDCRSPPDHDVVIQAYLSPD
jgi:hypothetical protein